MIVGVDVGGTFTDLVVIDPATELSRSHKLPSTPADPAEAVLAGLAELGIDLAAADRIVHGTTVATNTILQRNGAVTGLITTEGHRDVLHIRRGNKPDAKVFDLLWDEPEPLVPRYLRLDVAERVDYRGAVVQPLDEDELRLAVDHLVGLGVESIAVCFLFSYLNADHERRAAAMIEDEHPRLFVSASSSILPQWREYERSATTVADAYVKPRMASYLDHLARALVTGGFSHDLSIMKSNGGVMTAASARQRPVETFLSGPAGGVVASKHHGAQVASGNIISIDMGGTSFDVALITGGEPGLTMSTYIDDSTPLGIPMLDIRTIGAGGGSIAWVDPGGILKVGPASAGADPGPACYGRGGTDPTVTDANVVLGRIGPDTLLGGRMVIDPALARRALTEHIAEPLGIDPVEAAAGIIRITVANMATAIRSITAEAGVDPREYVLLAGGGGGPLHATQIAAEFDIGRVVVPSYPGLLSAGGLIVSDLKVDVVKSFPMRLERDGVEELGGVVEGLVDDALVELRREGHAGDSMVTVALDMRYLGQNWEISVPIAWEDLSVAGVAGAFDQMHDQLYGFALPQHLHEILAVRCSAVGPTPDAAALLPGRFTATGAPSGAGLPEPRSTRDVWGAATDAFAATPVHARDDLRPGHRGAGPVIIEGIDAAVWVPAGWEAAVDATGNLVLDALGGVGGGPRA